MAQPRVQQVAGILARVLVVQLFLGSAIKTLMGGWSGLHDVVASHGYPAPNLWVGAAVALELVASVALFVPVATRWAALALAGYAVIATSLFHSNFKVPGEMHLFIKDWSIAGALLLFFIAERARERPES